MKSPDLASRQFGELTVIRRVENTKYNASQWLCRCSCGADYVARGSPLLAGKKTRCPSKAHQKTHHYVDITGQRFG